MDCREAKNSLRGRTVPWLLGVLCLFAATAAHAANDQIIWENQGIADGGTVANGHVLTDQLGIVTATYGVTITNLPSATSTFSSATTGNHAGFNRLAFDHNDNDPNDRMTITLTFSQPVSNLQFSLLDVDRSGTSWVDAVEILYNGNNNARTDGFALPVNGLGVANDNETYMEGFEGTASTASTTVDGNVGVNFGATLVSSVTIRYFSSDDAGNNPSAQFIGVSDLNFVAARLTLRKTWVGATLNDAVNITATRSATVIDSLASIANTANETDTDPTPILVFTGNMISFAETFTTGSAGNYAAALTCSGAADTNPNDGLLVAAADANIVCTYTNRSLPVLSLFKTSNVNAGTFNFNLTNADTDVSTGSVGNQNAASITTATPGTPVQFDASSSLAGTQNIRIATFNTPVVITEAQTAGFNLQAATSCTAGTSGATFTQSLVNNGTTGGSMTITPPVGGFTPGATIACTFVNASLQANLSITKTDNATQVISGTSTTYTIVVANTGPDPVTGAVVRDTPGAGLTCPPANPVTCAPTGNCPAGPLTVGNLTSGITLPVLTNGATATLSFSCNVQ